MTVSTKPLTAASPTPDVVDVRGPRFAALITTTVLIAVLALVPVSVPAAATLLALQAIVFGTTALVGPRRGLYGQIYSRVLAPRLAPVSEREPAAPLRFAQLLGFVFSAVGLIGFAVGAAALGIVFTGFALFAAFLNGVFGICLGCKIYPLVTRFRR